MKKLQWIRCWLDISIMQRRQKLGYITLRSGFHFYLGVALRSRLVINAWPSDLSITLDMQGQFLRTVPPPFSVSTLHDPDLHRNRTRNHKGSTYVLCQERNGFYPASCKDTCYFQERKTVADYRGDDIQLETTYWNDVRKSFREALGKAPFEEQE